LSLIHFIGDFYNSFIIALLPIFIGKFSLTLVAPAGLIAGLSRFLAFVVQPLVRWGFETTSKISDPIPLNFPCRCLHFTKIKSCLY